MDIMNIIAGITGFMQFFVPGYVFLSCYNFVSCTKREDQIHYLIIKSITISFIFSLPVSLIGKSISAADELILLAELITALLLGALCGRLHRCRWVKWTANFLFKRGFSTSEFVELWETAITEKHQAVCLLLKLKGDHNTYEGQLDSVIAVNTDPKIFLTNYICTDSAGKTICDHIDEPDYKMVIKYDDIERFEFRYIPQNEKHEE